MTLVTYIALIIFPFPILFWINEEVGSNAFVISLFIYALMYRPVLDSIRLIDRGILSKSKFWKPFIPFWSVKYLKELFFTA